MVMKYILISILCFLFTIIDIHSQDSLSIPTPTIRWSMTLAQSAVRDYRKGENSSIEFNNLFDITQPVKYDRFDFNFNLKADLGFTNISDKLLMKEFLIPKNNLLYGEGKVKYKLGWKIDPFFMASFKTQIVTAYIFNRKEYVESADFWDPVESMQTIGFEYFLVNNELSFTSNFGFTLRQIRAKLFTTMTDDYKTTNIKERYKAENGLRWKTAFFIKLDSAGNNNYKSTLDLFGSFKNLKEWSFTWDNDLKLAIWKSLGFLLRLSLVNDLKQLKKLQYNQSLSFGIIVDL
jgi:hypothetical protein